MVCFAGPFFVTSEAQRLVDATRYPTDRPNSGEVLVPLWLRMEHNDIEVKSFWSLRLVDTGSIFDVFDG